MCVDGGGGGAGREESAEPTFRSAPGIWCQGTGESRTKGRKHKRYPEVMSESISS